MIPCPLHPTYKAITAPTGECPACWQLWTSLPSFSLANFEASDDQKRITRLVDDLRIARAAATAANKATLAAERIREAVFNLTAAPLDVPEWARRTSTASDVPHVPVLMTSDFQLGETIDAENMDGINEFNIKIAQQRYRTLINKSLDIGINHLPKNRYEGAIYLRLGDAVSGDIHLDLLTSNEQGGVEAVRTLVEMETWGIRQLVAGFGNIHVVSVPGNHGRTSLKPPTKAIAETNLDTLSAWWLQTAFREDSRVTWQTPNSTDAVVTIQGRRYLATHGDNMGARGGQGFIGPAATVLRGFKKTHDEYARRGDVLEGIFCGHFHTALDVGLGWCNGSLPGYSEFARVNRMTPEPPQQWLLFFHPKYGITSQWKVRV